MKIYVVHQLAKEINGDFVSSMIEYASKDRLKAEEYANKHQLSEPVMNIESHLCNVVRMLVEVELEE